MPPLSEMPLNTVARIAALDPGLMTDDPELAARLMEMGMLPGTAVRVVRVAPLGDPIDVEVRGYHLSLRRRDAGLITVEEMAP